MMHTQIGKCWILVLNELINEMQEFVQVGNVLFDLHEIDERQCNFLLIFLDSNHRSGDQYDISSSKQLVERNGNH